MANTKIGTKFISVPESLIGKYDLCTAALYGVIWSFSQMDKKVCMISQSEMGEILGVSARTINAKFKLLKDAELVTIKFQKRFPNGGTIMHLVTNPAELEKLDREYLEKQEKKKKTEYIEETGFE